MSAKLAGILLVWMWCPSVAFAQDIEPRRWSHFPVGAQVGGIGYIYAEGDLQFDPVLRIEQAEVDLHTVALSYLKYFSLLDRTARIEVLLPVQSGSWDGLVDGAPRSVERNGAGDPHVRLSWNWAGAPALRGKEFLAYRAAHTVSTSAGVALDVQLPLGEYRREKLINLGENRFVLRPEIGVLHTRGLWSFELTGATYFYQDNDEFFGGNRLEQDPLYTVQAHVVRSLASGWWVAAGAAGGWDASSRINGVDKDDARRNVLYGASIGLPVGRAQAIRLAYLRRRPLEDAGPDNHNLLLSWNLRW